MRVKINLSVVFDLDELRKRLLKNPVGRISDIFKIDLWVEKLK